MNELFLSQIATKFCLEWFCLLQLFIQTIIASDNVFLGANIIYAVNCGELTFYFGGKTHTDVNGIEYIADPLLLGVASDYGSRLNILRVDPRDAILYQTERYDTNDFSYEIPTPLDDGEYTLVMKFCEVYFQAAEQKIFDVLLNGETIISELDIWKEAGGIGVAHDELFTFYVKGGSLLINGEQFDVSGELRLTFAKGPYDNPKINAFYLYRGPKSDIPPLLDMTNEVEEEQEEVEDSTKSSDSLRYAEGPAVEDPYAEQDSSHMFIPFLVAFACFFPVLFCLCKL
ncbi:unnamed protein product [Anisakis simplex]|uniref:Malectin (inferred by orthology to a human protein) n=1 Tax=Anisakis simplex TaxID=6269 RepID=A0A0M3JWI1_ANISI|nr:unnamed protein product [Anisakis simplex]